MICCCVSTQPPSSAQTKQMNQLMNQLEKKVIREKELEQECEQLRQRIEETVSELGSSEERSKVSSGSIYVRRVVVVVWSNAIER